MKRNPGFTLIEMMITVVVLAVLLTIAVPSFHTFILNNRLTTQANEFITSIQTARSEAVRRGGIVVRMTAVPSTADNEWGKGWAIWVDANNNNTQDAGEVIQGVEALAGGNTLNSDPGNVSEFRLYGNGSINISDTLHLTDDRTAGGGCGVGEQPGRTINIKANGQVSVSPDKCLP